MTNFESQFHSFELPPNALVRVIASLDNSYFLKTEQGKYVFINADKIQYEEVSENMVASAIIKHGYKPLPDGQVFEFGKRKEVL